MATYTDTIDTQSVAITANDVGSLIKTPVVTQSITIAANNVFAHFFEVVQTSAITITANAVNFTYRKFHRIVFTYQALRTAKFTNDKGVGS